MASAGTRTRASSAALRARVIEAALACFNEHGYGAVSVETIRNAAGISVGSLYHHFDSKASLAAAVYAEAIRSYHAALLEVLTRNPDAEDGVRSLIEAHHRWVSANRDRAGFMIRAGDLAEIKAEAYDHAVANDRLITALVEWAQPLMDGGQLASFDPLVFASVLFGPSYFHTRVTLSRSADTPSSDVAADFAAAAWRTTRGPTTRTAL